MNSLIASGSDITCIHLELLAEASELAVDGTEDVVSFELVVVLAGDEVGLVVVAVAAVVADVVVVLTPVAIGVGVVEELAEGVHWFDCGFK